jgi:L-ornithine N5-monooxygenase
VAIEESGSRELAERTLVLEQYPDVKWQRNLLLPWACSQVSFLKDLVPLRNPRSRFSFLSFLHDRGRLDEFVNLGTFHPFRWELSDYMRWVTDSLEHVGIRYGARGEHVEPQHGDDGTVVGWTVTLTGGDTVRCRVIGIGRDPYVPEVFRELPADRVIHSTQYCSRIAETPTDRPIRAVVGSAQSAAEMFMALHQDLPLSGSSAQGVSVTAEFSGPLPATRGPPRLPRSPVIMPTVSPAATRLTSHDAHRHDGLSA